jgi:ATP-dependent Lon protease
MSDTALVLPTRDLVLFPGMIRVVPIGRPVSLAAVRLHSNDGTSLVCLPQLDADIEDPTKATFPHIGTVAQVVRIANLPDGTMRILVEGLGRAALSGPLTEHDGALQSAVQTLDEEASPSPEVEAQARQVVSMLREFLFQNNVQPQEQPTLVPPDTPPSRLADQVAGMLDVSLLDRISMLEEVNVGRRLDLVIHHLSAGMAHQRIANEVNEKVQAAMDDSQRKYHLKEQLKAIRVELGEAVGVEAEADVFAERIKAAKMPEEVSSEALREVQRLRSLHVESAEYTVARTWLETICDIPWSAVSTDTTDLTHASQVLDNDHYGLTKVKERILEYLAVRQLNPDAKGATLCFVGPPGVGKTSLGQSIARALGREYGRVSLGGIKDESEIRGHRRTYVGALPGRIIRALIRAKSKNPVLVLDELDKVGNDFRGDPASALLEVLDPEQNKAFADHYVDLPVDLSEVMFIATANVSDPIPPPLLDRLEVIEIDGYIEEDKAHIAHSFLLPKLGKNHGLGPKRLEIAPEAVVSVIRDYTREAGLRDLDRQLATLHRKVARKFVEGRKRKIRVQAADLTGYLGPARYHQELAERVDQPGVVIGLAWTAAGGDILFIEAARMPGKPGLKLTGSLGDVMKESAEAAMSWLRSNASQYNLDAEAFKDEYHLHVPAGGIPKDGPSAGVTMVCALASIVTGRPVKPRIAMTGEITLRGKVLPVGGVREKVLAARRAGVTDVLLPTQNKNDLIDVPAALRKDLRFHFVDEIAQVLELALTPPT